MIPHIQHVVYEEYVPCLVGGGRGGRVCRNWGDVSRAGVLTVIVSSVEFRVLNTHPSSSSTAWTQVAGQLDFL